MYISYTLYIQYHLVSLCSLMLINEHTYRIKSPWLLSTKVITVECKGSPWESH